MLQFTAGFFHHLSRKGGLLPGIVAGAASLTTALLPLGCKKQENVALVKTQASQCEGQYWGSGYNRVCIPRDEDFHCPAGAQFDREVGLGFCVVTPPGGRARVVADHLPVDLMRACEKDERRGLFGNVKCDLLRNTQVNGTTYPISIDAEYAKLARQRFNNHRICPYGADKFEKNGAFCKEGTGGYSHVYGPFSKKMVEACTSIAGAAQCERNRWDLKVAESAWERASGVRAAGCNVKKVNYAVRVYTSAGLEESMVMMDPSSKTPVVIPAGAQVKTNTPGETSVYVDYQGVTGFVPRDAVSEFDGACL